MKEECEGRPTQGEKGRQERRRGEKRDKDIRLKRNKKKKVLLEIQSMEGRVGEEGDKWEGIKEDK